jgi:hypothetical protein
MQAMIKFSHFYQTDDQQVQHLPTFLAWAHDRSTLYRFQYEPDLNGRAQPLNSRTVHTLPNLMCEPLSRDQCAQLMGRVCIEGSDPTGVILILLREYASQ